MAQKKAIHAYIKVWLVLIVLSFILAPGCNSDTETSKKMDSDTNKGSRAASQVEAVDYAKLVGRWLRPDGGYIIEIQNVDMNGKMNAAYYNPRSINVSQSLASQKDGIIEIFIELRDTGYPGATYTLKYDQGNDILTGLYYQPSLGQTFDVQFVRKE
jgi:hypothetical protein